ncbi:MAG: thioredoxin family protein [Kiritimatiellae bacterium]|nr:thioredoxin family protein [Kiritimatiellia bacterium]
MKLSEGRGSRFAVVFAAAILLAAPGCRRILALRHKLTRLAQVERPVAVPVETEAASAIVAEPSLAEPSLAERLLGTRLSEAKKVLGQPMAHKTVDGVQYWFYADYTVASRDGRTVTSVERDTGELVVDRKAVADAAKEIKVQTISNGGQTVDLNAVLVPGNITVIDFYADWCGPCLQLAPVIERICSEHDDVFLRKINIVDWNTPVTQQYGISSVPNIRVFDGEGRQVGQPTHSPNEVSAYIAKARVVESR